MRGEGRYLFEGKLDNCVHDVTYEQLKVLEKDFLYDVKENARITGASYNNQTYFPQYDFRMQTFLEGTYQDQKTEGLKKQYPHGIVMQQAGFRHFYRGENRKNKISDSTLCRAIRQKCKTLEDQELYRLVSDMRIAEFRDLLNSFRHVKEWDYSDVLYECIAQHYGLETSWLDITSSFDAALFFATCFFKDGKWFPLTRNETENNEDDRYGMIFHMPSWQSKIRWCYNLDHFQNNDPVCIDNLIYPIGFQPFMRCYMQHGYGIYMRESRCLQQDPGFEKLRFRHNEDLSKRVYEKMHGGELIYPHEGLDQAMFLIEHIKKLTVFSESSLKYALGRNHRFCLSDEKEVKERLDGFLIDGNPVVIADKREWHLSGARRKRIDNDYENFNLEKWYGIHPVSRPSIYKDGEITGPPMYEPYMMYTDLDHCPGRVDFSPRAMEEANINADVTMYMSKIICTSSGADYRA